MRAHLTASQKRYRERLQSRQRFYGEDASKASSGG
jgi:hypothetical protein